MNPQRARQLAARRYSIWRRLLYWYLRALSRVAGIVLYGVRVRGLEHLPRGRAYILAPNHHSFLDPWLVGLVNPDVLSYLARDTLFRVPGLGHLIAWLNTLPVARDRSAPRQGLQVSVEALSAGKSLVLFPEGTRSRDGALGPLRRGIYLIARQSRSPVVPAYILGSFEAWSRHQSLPRLSPDGPVCIVYGAPVHWNDGGCVPAEAQARDEKNLGEAHRLVDDGSTHPSSPGPLDSLPAARPDRPRLPSAGGSPLRSGPGTDGDTTSAAERAPQSLDDRAHEQSDDTTKRKTSAAFFATLGESYRVLESRARGWRQYLFS